nr:pancreatic triacylglycerol lipase-like [Onthophagus taurus]
MQMDFLIHGWTEHASVQWYTNVINAYLKRGYYNIIAVDWSSKGDADYLSASRYTRGIGEKIGIFLVKLHKRKGIPLKNIHLLSHSLGAHVCGFVGKKIYELTGDKIGRITAMDPAAPLFEITQDMRLSKENAKFVDVIHTDGGMLGFRHPIGTVDFFPNGGSAIQPGCSLLKADLHYDDCMVMG